MVVASAEDAERLLVRPEHITERGVEGGCELVVEAC
jgi:hypothetical protein